MVTISPKYLNQIAQYLGAPLGKITQKDNIYTRVNNNQTSTGTINIIFSFLKDSKSNLGPNDPLQEAAMFQWLEYGIVYAANANNGQNVKVLLRDLNTILSTQTYLVGHRLTVSDVFLYYVLADIMAGLSSLDKEKFLNVSRWYDNIQQDAALRQKNNFVDFSSNYLANLVPARH
ncbi:unnamed protein product [Ceutorhynchus assimilis]|uniref:GST C-terminal domain-containing protein n=1 Tax=Ceutorhynchus assimilis TaxID=467358 RepID=A0A9N9MKI7_9CUCU|nr:unnamed protein product [Ceutorhynchus assimilis]